MFSDNVLMTIFVYRVFLYLIAIHLLLMLYVFWRFIRNAATNNREFWVTAAALTVLFFEWGRCALVVSGMCMPQARHCIWWALEHFPLGIYWTLAIEHYVWPTLRKHV